jgi:cytochrome b involved in lipid metabolism
MSKVIDAAEVAKHKTKDSCWVILYGNVYDVRTSTSASVLSSLTTMV